MHPTMRNGFSRRQFLSTSAGAGLAACLAPEIIPASALGADGSVAPSSRITMGAIGVGGRGSSDLGWALHEPDVHYVAVCDVSKGRREGAKRAVDQRNGNSDCATYIDFRELLARKDIDALNIAPGDRWHTPMSILAMRSGKDVYSEKPGTMTIAEGQALVAAERQYARIFQTGTQRRAETFFIIADELARQGRLGKVHTVYAHTLIFKMMTQWLPAQPEPPKSELDWDLWLGPAPWRPYNGGYLGGCGNFLDHYDFGTGVAGWGSHTVCQCQGAIDADLTSPVEYEFPNNDTSDGFTARFANGVKLVMAMAPKPWGGDNGMWHGTCGVKYEGSEGWVSIADGYRAPEVSSPALLSDHKKLVSDYLERNQRPPSHMRDFLNCIKTRRKTVSHAEVAHRSMSTCHIINISMLLKRSLKWDPVKEEFLNDAEANRMRSRSIREPWRL
jgi:predicted dehydrogenase